MPRLTRRLTMGFVAVFILSLFTGLVTWYNMRRNFYETQLVNKSYEVIGSVRLLEQMFSEMEAARRGFRITGIDGFLRPYRINTQQVSREEQKLEQLLLHKPDLNNRMDLLKTYTAGLLRFWDSVSIPASLPPRSELIRITYEEQNRVGAVRAVLQSLAADEQTLLAQRQRSSALINNYTAWQLLGSIIVIEGIIFSLVIVVRREFRRRRHVEEKMQRQLSAMARLSRMRDEKNWLLQGISQVHDALQESRELKVLAEKTLHTLITYTGSVSGALYLLDAGSESVKRIAGLGLPAGAPEVFRIGEGLPGYVAASGKTVRSGALAESSVELQSGTITARPAEVLLVPFCYNKEVKGVLELASVRAFSQGEVTLAEDVSTSIAVSVDALQANNRAGALLHETRIQKEALEHQQEELRQTNEALTQQAEELQVGEEEMKVREEELRQVNDELERQNEMLQATREALTQQAAALERSGRYKNEFLANMSHELRTPLNSILILARLLEEGKNTGQEKQQEYAGIIHKSGADLLALINDILDLSKIEAGKLEIENAPVHIEDLGRQMDQLFQVQAAEKDIQFGIVYDAAAPQSLHTDAQRLAQILKNLLSNAIKFTHNGGSVTLIFSGRKQNSGSSTGVLQIAVKDTGIGIPLSSQHQIFEAFQQADGAVNRKYGGTGLGLSISRELARLLGGSLTVESKPEQGSTFTLHLPVVEAAAQPATSARQESYRIVADDRAEVSATDRPFLIAEDDLAFAAVLRDVAREQGVKCIIALHGDDAWHCLNHYHPAALILNMHLPGMDGWQLLRRMDSDAELRRIPVHVISADAQRLPAGPVAVLRKPATKEALTQAFALLKDRVHQHTKKLLIIYAGGKIIPETIQQSLAARGLPAFCDHAADIAEALSGASATAYDAIILNADGNRAMLQLAAPEQLLQLAKESTVLVYGAAAELDKHPVQSRPDNPPVIWITPAPEAENRLMDELEIVLLAAKTHAAVLPAQAAAPLQDNDVLQGRTILIADDDMRNVFALSTLLQSQGVSVITAANGLEALAQLEQHPETALVLLDVMMPEMDGNEAVARIRGNQEYKELPVIMLTAKAMTGDREKSIAAGANDYVTKPIDSARLLSLLRVWLQGRRRPQAPPAITHLT